jgi:hypothetical protein
MVCKALTLLLIRFLVGLYHCYFNILALPNHYSIL